MPSVPQDCISCDLHGGVPPGFRQACNSRLRVRVFVTCREGPCTLRAAAAGVVRVDARCVCHSLPVARAWLHSRDYRATTEAPQLTLTCRLACPRCARSQVVHRAIGIPFLADPPATTKAASPKTASSSARGKGGADPAAVSKTRAETYMGDRHAGKSPTMRERHLHAHTANSSGSS